jgi:hypothetical protein
MKEQGDFLTSSSPLRNITKLSITMQLGSFNMVQFQRGFIPFLLTFPGVQELSFRVQWYNEDRPRRNDTPPPRQSDRNTLRNARSGYSIASTVKEDSAPGSLLRTEMA